MRLQYPAPTLSFPLDAVSKVVASTLKQKHWHHFKTGTMKLVYVPIWIFTYEAYVEQNGVVTNELNGKIAIDATNGNVWEAVPYVLDEMPIETTMEPKHEYRFEAKDVVISKDEAKELATVKLSSMLGIPRQNIKIVGGEVYLWPLWRVWVEVQSGNYRLDIDAVSGTLFGAEQVPERELGWYEITAEVLQELHSPSGWVKYINLLADVLHVPRYVVWLVLILLVLFLLKLVIPGW
jgi:hypothetical protein